MRVALAALGLACLLLSPSAARAQAIGNPVFSSYDFVLQATVEYGSSDRDLDVDRSRAVDSTLDTTLLKVILGIHPRFDLYLTVGSISFDMDTQDLWGQNNQNSQLDNASDIAYGGGARWTFWDSKRIKAAVGVSTLLFSASDKVQNTNLNVDWWEYEASIGASFPIFAHATPYIGASYCVLDATLKGPNNIDMKADDPIGIFLGVDVPLNNYFSLTHKLI